MALKTCAGCFHNFAPQELDNGRCLNCRRVKERARDRSRPPGWQRYDAAYRAAREQVLAEEDRCWLCYMPGSEGDPLEVDHVVPPGTMVFVTFEYLRDKVEEPISQAGASAMADPEGNIVCWWMDKGQPPPAPPFFTEADRRVTATTNDGTGRTVEATITGRILNTD